MMDNPKKNENWQPSSGDASSSALQSNIAKSSVGNSEAKPKSPEAAMISDRTSSDASPSPEHLERNGRPDNNLPDPVSVESTPQDCYRYEGDVCVYKDPSSGVEYVFCSDTQCWLKRNDSDPNAPPRPSNADVLSEKCFTIGDNYCYRDDSGALYRLNSATNSWQLWDKPPGPALSSFSSSSSTGVGGGTAEAHAADHNYYSDADGVWCYRSSDVCYRWHEERGWIETPASDGGDGGGGGRSKDDCEAGGGGIEGDCEAGGGGIKYDCEAGGGGIKYDCEAGGGGIKDDCEAGGGGIKGDCEVGGGGIKYDCKVGSGGSKDDGGGRKTSDVRQKRARRPNRGSSDESEHDSDSNSDGDQQHSTTAAAGKKCKRQCSANATEAMAPAEDEDEQRESAESRRVAMSRENMTVNNDGVTIYTDPADGSKYEWDPQKSAWFPHVDEEFLALHSLNYGFDSEGRPVDTPPILQSVAPPPELPPPPPTAAGGRVRQMKAQKQPEWFELEQAKNTKVYVSGLDDSTSEQEFVELMSKCGLVMKDPATNRWKVKLYEDDYGVRKGDALCTYIKVESVQLAVRILDGSQFKQRTISVQPAQFSLRGQFDPRLKPKKRALKRKDREKLQKKQERLFAWQPDRIRGEREKHERVMILTNAFDPREFDQQPQLIIDYRQDVGDECAKYGAVRKVVVHDRHPAGVVEVVFGEAAEADACIAVMNGRWFAGRQVLAHTWDGKTKYRVEETEEERKKRLEQWDKFVEEEEQQPDDSTVTDTKQQTST